MDAQFARQGFLGPRSDQILASTRVAIIGLGGGGSHIVQQLAHIGVGNFLLIDDDCVEKSNLNRLVGATRLDALLKRRKTAVAGRLIKRINPRANVRTFNKKWHHAANFLRDRDVIFGCVDTLTCRRELETAARRYLTPYIDIGMDVHAEGDQYRITGQVILSMPGCPCLRCLGLLREDLLAEEANRYGAAGARSQVVWPNGVLASCAVGVFVNLITPWHDKHKETQYLEYDGNTHSVVESNRLLHLDKIICTHFNAHDNVGNPFWRPEIFKGR